MLSHSRRRPSGDLRKAWNPSVARLPKPRPPHANVEKTQSLCPGDAPEGFPSTSIRESLRCSCPVETGGPGRLLPPDQETPLPLSAVFVLTKALLVAVPM